MTILEYLNNKYGHEQVSCELDKFNHGDRNFKILFQHLLLSELGQRDDLSYYHSHIIDYLNTHISNKFLLYELCNIICKCDFTFKQYNTCITYGTFDLFHYGHLNLLTRIKSLCSTLIVGVSTDEFNLAKGKTCTIPYSQRSRIVENIKGVDKVIPENSWEQKEHDIKQYHVDAIIMGNDWEGRFDYLSQYCAVIYLPRTNGISTTELKQRLVK